MAEDAGRRLMAEGANARAETLLKLARMGAAKWNRWIRTVIDGDSDQVEMLGLKAVAPLNQKELKELRKEAGIRRAPELDFRLDPGLNMGVINAACFEHVDFAGIEHISFNAFAFPAGFSFDGARFGGGGEFSGARFGDSASFDGVNFAEYADFSGSSFCGTVFFRGVFFSGPTAFNGARFGDHAYFDGAIFRSSGTLLHGNASFMFANFSSLASFDRVRFGGQALFVRARFGGPASLEVVPVPETGG